MLIKTYNQEGKEIGKTRLPKEIFDIEMKTDLVHQVAVSQMANRRQGNAQTKDRGDVSGGGKKPWRQKGTGRARHGSIRSPIWIGGGVTFGPRKEKNYKKIIPKKMRRKALFMVLSEKARNNLLILVDKLEIKQGKTKEIYNVLKNLPCQGKSVLLGLPAVKGGRPAAPADGAGRNKNIVLAIRNIPKVRAMEARELNVLDLLSFKYLLMPKESVKTIEETFRRAQAGAED